MLTIPGTHRSHHTLAKGARIGWQPEAFGLMLAHVMKDQAHSHTILWHTGPLPHSGQVMSGHANTPFGTMNLVWTKDHILEAGFAETGSNHRSSPLAQQLADLILSYSPLPIQPLATGTPFQLRVWQALTRIPYGTTTSYREIATAIGSPRATRAVGTAIGANRLAILIPCHRVIRNNGQIGGFGWGIPTKLQLLQHEQYHPNHEP